MIGSSVTAEEEHQSRKEERKKENPRGKRFIREMNESSAYLNTRWELRFGAFDRLWAEECINDVGRDL
jgi:hypothetical protein